MKKLLGILVLGLLWCNVGLSDEIYYESIAMNPAPYTRQCHWFLI